MSWSYNYNSNTVDNYHKTTVFSTHKNLWIIQVSCFAVVSIVLFGALIAASMDVKDGFPCFFAAVVDYKNTNDTAIRLGMTTPRLGGVSPVLFLEPYGVAFYYFSTSLILLFVTFYFIASSIVINTSDAESDIVVHLTSLVCATSTLLMGTISVWLFQTTVIVLTYKLIVLAAAVYIVYFILYTVFLIYFCGRGVSSTTYADEVSVTKQFGGSVHRLVGNARAVVANLLCGLYGMSIIMACLMFGMLLANSFAIKFKDIIIVALLTTSLATSIFLLVVELLAARYVHMLLGPHIGLLIGYGMLWNATIDYTDRFYFAMAGEGSELQLACKSVLGVFIAVIILSAIVRISRAAAYHRTRFTRAYSTAQKFRNAVKDRTSRIIKRRNRREFVQDDMLPLRTQAYSPDRSDYSESSEEEVIYDTVADEEPVWNR